MNQKNEQDLIKIAREGLKEDIREGLESEEFATLQVLFLEAAEVEEILEMDKSPEEKPRRQSLTATNSTADGVSLSDSSVSIANIVVENSAAGGGSIADSSLSVADSVADNSAARLGSISGSN
ncbi:unnamed protein product, partial [Brassica rapa subsp. trilocularis]